MSFALSCVLYAPRHAAPSPSLTPSGRQVLAVGLTAAVLPLGAAPALAVEPAVVAPAAVAPAAVAPAAVAPVAVVPVAVAKAARATTTLKISAPSSAPTGSARVGVRLQADGHAVRDGYVRVERSTGSGWAFAGRLLTDRNGVGAARFHVSGTASLRAAYTGTTTRSATVSAVRTVRAAARGASALHGRTVVGGFAGARVLSEAARHIGAPYVYGASGPSAFDCSGFTRYVYAKLGVSLPHNSEAQAAMTRTVSRSEARAGDLVHMPGHVGIYAGNGMMYDAPHSGARVTLRRIYTAGYTVHRVV
jgi:cell wall-associated NlpC family hydrolase